MVASRPSIYLQPSHICNNDDNDHALGEEEILVVKSHSNIPLMSVCVRARVFMYACKRL